MTSSETLLPFKKVKLRPARSKGNIVRAGQGHVPDFYPGGMPVPTWCAVINPRVHDGDPTSEPFHTRALSHYFQDHLVDGVLLVVQDVTIEDACQSLWKAAKTDAGDHAYCHNGGAYAVWDLKDGRLLLGGFDNAGCDVAVTTMLVEAHTWGRVVSECAKAHFDIAALMMDPDEEHPVYPATPVPPSLQDVLKLVPWETPRPPGPRF